jgi:hypothetical protein
MPNSMKTIEQQAHDMLQRAIFVYEAARMEAVLSGRRIIPEHWGARHWRFRARLVEVVDKQCFGDKFESAEAAHNSWWRMYESLGWVYGPERDPNKKTHPDMIPFSELPKDERDKDEIFLRLCAVAEIM